MPPTIVPGDQLLPAATDLAAVRRDQASIPPENDLELSLCRIEIPGKLAASSTPSVGGNAAITPAVQQVTDTRVVELAFHPSLSRAANFDEESDDDGVYLVLLPKNERGQMVPVAADLSVVILDLEVREPGRRQDRSLGLFDRGGPRQAGADRLQSRHSSFAPLERARSHCRQGVGIR